jgi:hypothetical protein
MSYGDNAVRARMPFVDVVRPQAQTGGRRHPGTDGAAWAARP